MSSNAPPPLANPRRVVASNLVVPASTHGNENIEPGVEVRTQSLTLDDVMGGVYRRATIGTHTKIPASNDGHGELPQDEIPGAGMVLPGGAHIYYLDIAPNFEGPLHRSTSTDYIIVLQGILNLTTPRNSFVVEDGRGNFSKDDVVETLCHPGDVVVQRGIMHALSNRTDTWVRVIAVVLSSDTNRVPVAAGDKVESNPAVSIKTLGDAWLQ